MDPIPQSTLTRSKCRWSPKPLGETLPTDKLLHVEQRFRLVVQPVKSMSGFLDGLPQPAEQLRVQGRILDKSPRVRRKEREGVESGGASCATYILSGIRISSGRLSCSHQVWVERSISAERRIAGMRSGGKELGRA